jgi:mRNA interferase HigB
MFIHFIHLPPLWSQYGNNILDNRMGTCYILYVHIIARRPLKECAMKHKDSKGPLDAWWHEVKSANWAGPSEIKNRYPSASFLEKNRVVFNFGGNKYRLVTIVNYDTRTVYVRFVGTHSEYDKINPEES